MSISYRWVIKGHEIAHGVRGGDEGCSGDGVAEDVEAVCTALTAAIRTHYGFRGPEALARVLTAYWGPLRHQALTDGVSATQKAGGHWKGSAGPITVELWCL